MCVYVCVCDCVCVTVCVCVWGGGGGGYSFSTVAPILSRHCSCNPDLLRTPDCTADLSDLPVGSFVERMHWNLTVTYPLKEEECLLQDAVQVKTGCTVSKWKCIGTHLVAVSFQNGSG